MVLPGTSLEGGNNCAKLLRSAFLFLDIEHKGKKLQATLSFGVAIFPVHGNT